ncbi:MAG: PilZ domain-containing protein [Desulfuromonadaceae bacterium]|nr:PilZ domain-containing protein [Desulfuromonadaceae bacterium]
MNDHRIHSRMKLHLQCHLIDHGGNTYHGLLKEISLGGALVKVDDDASFKIGDLCELVLGKNSVIFHLKRSGKIVRFDSERTMAVSFLNHMSLKEALSIHLNLTSHPSTANKNSLG